MLRRPRRYLLLLLALTLIAAGGWWWYYSTRPDYRFQRARQALARGDFTTADAHAEALEAAGEFNRAEFLRGESLMLSGHFADALKHFNQIEDKGALRREAILLSGRCLLRLHSLSEAIRAFAFVLTEDPDAVDAHQTLWDIALKRKASGGKGLGFMERMKLNRPTKDDKQNMLNSEKVLASDPSSTDAMVGVFQNALRAVLQVSKTDLNKMLASEKQANAGKPKRGPKPSRRG